MTSIIPEGVEGETPSADEVLGKVPDENLMEEKAADQGGPEVWCQVLSELNLMCEGVEGCDLSSLTFCCCSFSKYFIHIVQVNNVFGFTLIWIRICA